ncbi:hypothetical protein DFH09DRAFT_1334127 [Mycena vulgaris]|nr:hypothetical protein DFH09DRAFT_1334127 [Mycena vulgaris]
MQLNLNLSFVALAAALASVAVNPAPANPSKIVPLVDGHVYYSNFPREWNDDISSFGPDAGWSCTLYADPSCTGDTYTGQSFKTLPAFPNDKFSPVRCKRV